MNVLSVCLYVYSNEIRYTPLALLFLDVYQRVNSTYNEFYFIFIYSLVSNKYLYIDLYTDGTGDTDDMDDMDDTDDMGTGDMDDMGTGDMDDMFGGHYADPDDELVTQNRDETKVGTNEPGGIWWEQSNARMADGMEKWTRKGLPWNGHQGVMYQACRSTSPQINGTLVNCEYTMKVIRFRGSRKVDRMHNYETEIKILLTLDESDISPHLYDYWHTEKAGYLILAKLNLAKASWMNNTDVLLKILLRLRQLHGAYPWISIRIPYCLQTMVM